MKPEGFVNSVYTRQSRRISRLSFITIVYQGQKLHKCLRNQACLQPFLALLPQLPDLPQPTIEPFLGRPRATSTTRESLASSGSMTIPWCWCVPFHPFFFQCRSVYVLKLAAELRVAEEQISHGRRRRYRCRRRRLAFFMLLICRTLGVGIILDWAAGRGG